MTPLAVVPQEQLAWPAWVPPAPPRAQRCSAPGCQAIASQRHHAVARSTQRRLFGRVSDWLEIDGKLVLILVDLCGLCHDLLESSPGGCKARLRWAGGWLWYRRDPKPDREKDGIWWVDPKHGTVWKLKGYCRGEYTLDER